jgi:hypothetical protein
MTPEYENSKKTLALAYACCQGPVDPVLIRKFFKQAVMAHWEDPDNHGRYTDILSCYQPIGEDGRGNLNIMLSYEDTSGEKIVDPRIVIGVRKSDVEKKALGNIADVHPDGAHIETGWQMNSTLVLSHIFNDADIAMTAAQSTFEFLAGFGMQFMDMLNLNLFEPKIIDDPKIYGATKHPQTYFQVDVVFMMNYNFFISVNIESHRLKIISNDVTIT